MSMNEIDSNTLPQPDIMSGVRSMELTRIWLVDGAPRFIITPNLWEDPASWGLLVADLMGHIANAYEQAGHERPKVLARIKQAFDAEWSAPTSEAKPL